MPTITIDNVEIKCCRCPVSCMGMEIYYDHLVRTHRWPTEDAGSESGRAARISVAKADPDWPIYLRLREKFRDVL